MVVHRNARLGLAGRYALVRAVGDGMSLKRRRRPSTFRRRAVGTRLTRWSRRLRRQPSSAQLWTTGDSPARACGLADRVDPTRARTRRSGLPLGIDRCHIAKTVCTSRAWRNVLVAAYPDARVPLAVDLRRVRRRGRGQRDLPRPRGRRRSAHDGAPCDPGSTYTTLVSSSLVLADRRLRSARSRSSRGR